MLKNAFFVIAGLFFLFASIETISAQQGTKAYPDLVIKDLSLDKNCQVVVTIKNNGPGPVPDEVWTVHKPESSSVYLYRNGQKWGGATIWKFDPGKSLRNPGGTAIYTSKLRVSGVAEITATVDHTEQVKETNEGNNKMAKKLRCKATAQNDLTVRIAQCPGIVKPGQKLGNGFQVRGTSSFPSALTSIAVDIILTATPTYPSPVPYANYSPHYSNGVLLKGGREHISFASPGTVNVRLNGSNDIPTNTPLGLYYLGAVIDAGNRIHESNEKNNVSFCKIQVSK